MHYRHNPTSTKCALYLAAVFCLILGHETILATLHALTVIR